MAAISIIGYLKYINQGTTLQIVDFRFYGTSESLAFLLSQYRAMSFATLGGTILLFLGCFIVARYEGTYVSARGNLAAAMCSLVVMTAGFAWTPRLDALYFSRSSGHSTAVFSSIRELLNDFDIQAIYKIAQSPKQSASLCRISERPNVVIILHKSAAPFAYPRTTAWEEEAGDFFRPRNSQSGVMRVETWGGATWISDIGVLSGNPSVALRKPPVLRPPAFARAFWQGTWS